MENLQLSSKTNKMSFIQMDACNVAKYLPSLLSIEEVTYNELGKIYASEQWDATHFLSPRNMKFQVSYCAKYESLLVAFLICSMPSTSAIHVHRIAIDPRFRGQGLGRALLKHALDEWNKIENLECITSTVTTENQASLALFSNCGFSKSTGKMIECFLEQRKKQFVSVYQDYFLDERGVPHYVLCRRSDNLTTGQD